MTLVRIIALCSGLLLVGPQGPAAAADDDSNARLHNAINHAVVDRYALTGYESLQTAFEQQQSSLEGLCHNSTSLKDARLAYHQALDGWMQVSHIHMGPVEYFYRQSAFQFWPDRRNTVDKSLSAALKSKDPQLLNYDTLTRGSIALRGFPALERLLWAKKALTDQDEEGRYRCALASAIAAQMTRHAQEIYRDWQSEDGFAEAIRSADDGNDFFSASEEVATEWLRALITGIQTNVELRLARPLGKSPEKARAKKAENWRSARSLRNIQQSLIGLQQLYQSGFKPQLATKSELDKQIEQLFKSSIEQAGNIPTPLTATLQDPANYQSLKALHDDLNRLLELSRTQLPAAVSLHLGFNGLDGDG